MATSASQPIQSLPTLPTQPFRLDVPLHNLLQRPPDCSPLARVEHEPGTSLALPSPVFPQHPALMHELDAADIAAHDQVLETGKRHWPASKFARTMQGRTEKVDVTIRTHFTITATEPGGPVSNLQAESGRSCSPPYVELRIA